MYLAAKLVRQYLADHNLKVPAFARRVGTTRQNIENLLKRDGPYKLIPEWLPDLARLLGYQSAEALNAGEPPPTGGPQPRVAHELSLSPFDHADPITWEAVLNWRTAALPRRFILEMPDDSLASTVPRGTRLLFDKEAPPRPRWGVLVADRDGTPYVRRYVQGRGKEFTAEADRGYATLDSERDGLQVLAALVHRMADGEV